MATEALSFSKKPMGPARSITYGAIVVGLLDLLDAIVFYGLMGARPIRIFQSIASGLLGRAAFAGGLPTALLGAALHFFIAFAIVSTYYLASRQLGVLRSHPVVCGLVYGVLVYFFMNLVVLPLSATGKPSFALPVLLNGIIGHALLVGIPSALFARRAADPANQ